MRMPWPFLLALIVAFGFDDLSGSSPVPPSALATRLVALFGGFAVLSLAAWLIGAWFGRRFERGASAPRLVRWFQKSAAALDWLALAVFAWGIFFLEWPRIVAWNLGLRSSILVDEIVTLLPYLLGQLAVWIGLAAPESRLLHAPRSAPRSRHLWLRSRQALGLMLPLLLLYGLGRDCVQIWAPGLAHDPVAQVVGLMLVALAILILAPAFVRVALPTRSLEPGPLRQRLEALGKRFGFRASDILIWDTGHTIVNAGVTGALPGFRYVLLTDALVSSLDPQSVEAVYGHEIGHVMHRHLAYFGFFFLGSIGMLALMDGVLQSTLAALTPGVPEWLDPRLTELAGWLGVIALLGAYFLLVFGFLSRRFERQADVFGCRAVSCESPDCPPHLPPGWSETTSGSAPRLCPEGIRIFSDALSTVAAMNGLSFEAPSWRHGSIAKRIAFLDRLSREPRELSRFQSNINRVRVVLALGLLLATLVAVVINRAS
jgi:STE24 endopeptidase